MPSAAQDYFAERAQKLKEVGYVPLPQAGDWNQPMPMSPQDEQVFGRKPNGLPENWDYRTATTSPSGKPLPAGAKGWNPDGSAWYGANSVFGNWWNGLYARLTSSNITSPEETAAKWATVTRLQQEGEQLAEDWKFTGDWGQYFNDGLAIAKKRLESFGSALDAGLTSQQNLAAGGTASGEEVANPSVVNFLGTVVGRVGRGVSEAVGGALALAQEPAQELEQIRGGIANISDKKSFGEEYAPALYDMIPEDGVLSKFSWFPSLLYSIDIPSFYQEITQAIVAPGSLSEKVERFRKGYEAGRILYSGVVDPLLKAEYMRRFEAGENPYLLAEELQVPGRELAGQILADPLNFIGLITKPLRSARWGMKAEELFASVAAPLRTAAQTLVKDGDELADLARITKMTEFVESGRTGVRTVLSDLSNRLNGFGTFAATQSGKRNYLSHVSGEWFRGIAIAAKGSTEGNWVEKVLDTVRGVMLLDPEDSAKFAKGMTYLNGSGLPMDVLLSRASLETGALLRQVDPTAVLKAVKDSGGDVAKLISAFDEIATKASGSLVPDLAKAGDLGASGTAFKAMNAVLESKPVRFISNTMSLVYMGVSPGYAFRNGLSNLVHIFTDLGAGAVLEDSKLWTKGARDASMLEWAQGILPAHYRQGIGPSAGLIGAEPTGANWWSKLDARRWSAWMESEASALIVHKTYKDTVIQGIQAMFDSQAETLLKLGASQADVATFRAAFVNFKGNPQEALKFLKESMAVGYVDVARNMEHVTPELRQVLNQYDLLEEYQKALNALPEGATLQEARAAQSEILSRAEQKARAFDSEVIHPDLSGPGYNDLHSITEAVHGGYVPDEMADLFGRVRTVNTRVDDYVVRAVNANTDLARKTLGSQVVDAWLKEHPEFMALKNGDLLKNARTMMDELAQTRKAILQRALRDDSYSIATSWKDLGMIGEAPTGIAYNQFREMVYQQLILPGNIKRWGRIRDSLFGVADNYMQELAKLSEGRVFDQQSIDNMFVAYADALSWDTAVIRNGRGYAVGDVAWNDQWVRGLEELPANATPLVNRAVDNGATPTIAQAFSEGMGGIRKAFDELDTALEEAWGTKRPVGKLDEALRHLEQFAKAEMPKVHLKASEVSRLARNFALHDYGARKNIDLAFAMVYPYSFWYSRSYANWMGRLATNAGTLAAYAKYRDYMAEVHAGLPEWWKYNVNSDELLGIRPDNPLYLNLEATLNPVNGLTGVDFNDPYKRVNWFTNMLDDLGKFGPTTWTPFAIATAIGLHMQGEDEAAARWAGRLFPFTQTLETVGVAAGLDPFNLDPNIAIFSGGVDPYLRNRVALALAAMVNEGQISDDEAIDAAADHNSPLWQEAAARAINERAPGQVMSFFAGVGFKARTASEITISEFDSDRGLLFGLRDTLSPDEYSARWQALEQKYPFMDALLIARKGDEERDSALAWNVLNRLPPGQSSIAQQAGIPRELVSKFYETKGDWETWTQSDRDRFMAGITDMRAILASPSAATRQEWDAASSQYKRMIAAIEGQLGERVGDMVDTYFQLKAESDQQARQYLQTHPQVEQYLDLKAQMVATDPLLSRYYGGIEQIEKYYIGVMYDQAESRFGEDIQAIQEAYFTARDTLGTTAGRAYLRQHPELKQYWDFLDAYRRDVLFPSVARLASRFREGIPVQARTNEPQSLGQSGVLNAIQPQPQSVDPQIIADSLGTENLNLVLDYLTYGAPLPDATLRKISQIAQQAGLSDEALLRLISQSVLAQD